MNLLRIVVEGFCIGIGLAFALYAVALVLAGLFWVWDKIAGWCHDRRLARRNRNHRVYLGRPAPLSPEQVRQVQEAIDNELGHVDSLLAAHRRGGGRYTP